jgi:hypothetical protein
MIFVVVISHGLLGDKIRGSCGGVFNMETLIESVSKNQSMIGYPKIFIFDFCRGSDVNLGELKVASHSRIPVGSDVFVGFATSSGCASATSPTGYQFQQHVYAQLLRGQIPNRKNYFMFSVSFFTFGSAHVKAS